MSNENVKIKIHESNKTSPAGRGIDSSDIAFIPGFSSLGSAPRNTPILCTTVAEFEEVFGAQPVYLSGNDINSTNYPNLGFVVGEPDRSYVFAKELLTSGMPVIYTNVVDEREETALENIAFVKSTDNTVATHTTDEIIPNNVELLVAKTAIRGSATVCFEYTMEPITDNDKTESFYFDPVISISDCDLQIAGVLLSKGNDTWAPMLLDSQPEGAKILIQIQLKGSCQKDTVFSLSFKKRTSKSRLADFYTKVGDSLEILKDRGEYSVKYITSGGYPSMYTDASGSIKSNLATQLIECAKTRGDAVALIDYEQSIEKPVYGQDSVYASIEGAALANGEYATAMYPWAEYTCSTITYGSSFLTLPASYAYLRCVAAAIKTSPNWLAMAGVSRGVVRGVNRLMTKGVLTNTLAEECQPKYGEANHSVSINCITNIRPYGLVLWGNRTLKPVDGAGTDALNFLNTRNMLSDIKKVLYSTAKSLMFEQNTELLWNRFKGGVSPLLDQLKSGGAISNYKIIKSTKTYSGAPLSKGELGAVVRVYPIHAIEFFDLTVEIRDDDVTVS